MTDAFVPHANNNPSPLIRVGDSYDMADNGHHCSRTLNIDATLRNMTMRARFVLIAIAQAGSRITFEDLKNCIDAPYSLQGMYRVQHAITFDCRLRDEPLLSSLVVSKATGEVSDGMPVDPFDPDDAAKERDRCYLYWQTHDPFPTD
ncbi:MULTISPECIES: hypothetical protein [Rhodococcus]|uniref:hypothetical protein n=1 Tax=Rhodococcus TaxID=1827 RepID=UPI001E440AB9|nr:hypothetical protein [Rhodococcus pyridinivorans]MCD2119620.1 hypothetical protein [Rhodococcus pyridinivorans]MCZ4628502.1 hypothetical protein [Rhodococcus pyridinivorans]MCZ4649779.1 hypothetical protein [Rhodococcus pyridinivorans]MDJ0484642.1 hypothetical protein [Rhodococcus pyridinivorans]MDV7255808.1 hypothetical protein [Rhodococcus pyridinivorans]